MPQARRRLRWPKGLLLFFGGWLLLLLAARLWWGWEAQRRLDRMLAEARARGDLLEFEDVASVAKLPDHENAAWWIEQAVKRLPPEPNDLNDYRRGAIDMRLNAGLSLLDDQVEWMTRVEGTLTALRAARDVPKAQALFALTRPTYLFVPLDGSGWRAVARTAYDAALVSVQEGDWARAIEFTHDAIALAHAHNDRKRGLIGRLVAIALHSLASSAAAAYAEKIELIDIDPLACPGGATRSGIESLITALLDETRDQVAWDDAVRAGAMDGRETILDMASGRAPPGFFATAVPPTGTPFDWLLRPYLASDLVRVEEYHLRMRGDEGRGPYVVVPPDVQALANPHNLLDAALSSAGWLMGSTYTAWTGENRMRAHRRTAACLLALRLYELDTGALPSALDELVPHYLSAVPPDPFAPHGEPLRYITGPTQTLVYSRNEDMDDDGGDGRNEQGAHIYTGNARDYVIFYRGAPRPDYPPRYFLAPLLENVKATNVARRLPAADLTPAQARRLLLETGVDDREVDESGGDKQE